MKKIVLLLLFWVMWGFALGTYILLGPLRAALDAARMRLASESSERITVFIYIIILVIASFLLAILSNKYFWKNGWNTIKVGATALPVLSVIIALVVWMNPDIVNKGAEEEEVVESSSSAKESNLPAEFVIGPYPEYGKLIQLKDRGFKAVISLLHPAVIPFEPKLLGEEQSNGKEIGIQIIHIPLLPWVTENTDAINSLRQVIKNAKGKYYVHCYLGKDRANMVKRLILQEHQNMQQESDQLAARTLEEQKKFERGVVYQLADQVYLTPLPTKEEFFATIIAGDFQQVISVVDMSSKFLKDEVEKNNKEMAAIGMSYRSIDSRRMSEAIAQQVKAMADTAKKPMVIYTFKTDNSEARAILKQYPSAKSLE